MNDFTKMELIALEDAMKNILLIHRPQDGISPLLDKIQYMIENYCEHVFIFTLNDSSVHCHKCGKNLNE